MTRRLAAVLFAAALSVLPLAPVAAQEATPVAPAAARIDLSGQSAAPFDAAMQAELDAYAADLAGRWGIVGASVAVTQGGETVFSRGYGVRELGGVQPVTPDTRFMIGSVTKGMTALMAATVVDDGLAAWDTPLVELLPGFALATPELTGRVTLADSFCACTGLPRDDFPLILNPAPDPAAMLATMAAIEPTAPFGEAFQYSNQMYGAGGFAAAVAAGGAMDTLRRDYELAMDMRVLGPAGMADSTFSLEEVLAAGNWATPHGASLDGTLIPIPLLAEERFVGPIQPAGALWSTAPDMARYLATELAGGVAPGGVRVVSAENLARTQAERATVDPALLAGQPPLLADSFGGYGMGWVTGTWNGLPLVHHSGGTLGFASEAAMLPDADAGIVLLTNGGPRAGMFNLAVQFRLFELLYGLEPQAGPELEAAVAAGEAAEAEFVASLQPADPAAVAPFAGTWTNPDLGELRIVVRDGVAEAAIGSFRSPLVPKPDGAPGDHFFARAPIAGPILTVSLTEGPDGATEVAIVGMGEKGDVVYPFARAE